MRTTIRPESILSACLVACLVYFPGLVEATDEQGEMMKQGMLVAPCFDCHGVNGVSMESDVPILAGQPDFFFIDNVIAFRARQRPCRETHYRGGDTSRSPTSMCDIVADLSDDDIQIIAAFFSSKQFVSQAQQTDPALVEAGTAVHGEQCARCHTQGGSVAEDDSGILAGQWMLYLRNALNDYRSGVRIALEENMQHQLDQLNESDVEALVHYFGSQGG